MLFLTPIVLFIILRLSKGVTGLCGSTEFPCNDGTCIEKSKWCDSSEDCQDDSDELYCFPKTSFRPNPNRCSDKFFICDDGPCIPKVGRCDGYQSCHDHSDEANCTTAFKTSELPHTDEFSTLLENETTHDLTTMSIKLLKTTVQTTASYEQIPTTKHILDIQLNDENRKSNKMVIKNETDSRNKIDRVKENEHNKVIKRDLTKGFRALSDHYFSHERHRAYLWLLSARDEEYGWGSETARAVTALAMSNEGFKRRNDSELSIKQLHLLISIGLVRNQTEQMPLTELSLNINALLALCSNPRNFHGYDLVSILRSRTNIAESRSEFVSPIIYLTLCLSNATSLSDLHILRKMAYTKQRIDMKALIALASYCVSRVPAFSRYSIEQEVMISLYQSVISQGIRSNIYQLALVIQALNEGKVNQDFWNRTDILHSITKMQMKNGSFGDILSTYYTMPVLTGGSLLSLHKHCHNMKSLPVPATESKRHEKYVHVSLYYGNPVKVTQTLGVHVPNSYNVLDIMKSAAVINPIYRFKVDFSGEIPSIYSIGGLTNDAERGLYWIMQVSNQNYSNHLQLYEGDIRSYRPNAGETINFWMKNVY